MIDDETASLIIIQDRIFRENFNKFIRMCGKTVISENNGEIETLILAMKNAIDGHKKGEIVVALSYMLVLCYDLDDHHKIDTIVGNTF